MSSTEDWEFYQSTGTLLGYNRSSKDLIIPAEINGVPVTRIGNWAFYDNRLTSVIIPNSVTSIGDWAFSNNLLTSVTIPNSVTRIGERAFRNNRLISIALPKRFNNRIKYVFEIEPTRFHQLNRNQLVRYYNQYPTRLICRDRPVLARQFGTMVMNLLVSKHDPPSYEEMVKVNACYSIPQG